MTLERTFDYDLVKYIVTHPKIYGRIGDDGSPAPDDWQPIQSDAVWYVLVKDETTVLGVFTLIPKNLVTYELHTCLLPEAWGVRASMAATELRMWVWDQIPQVQRVITTVPEENSLALRFAKKAGMKSYGFNPDSFLHHGKLMGEHLLGISRRDVCH